MGATPLAMLGLDRVVGRLSAITAHDCFDGRHGGVYVPRTLPVRAFATPLEVGQALLGCDEVVDRLRLRPGKIALLAADEESERLAAGFGHSLALAPVAARRRIAAVTELVHLARDAGVHALPAVTGHAASYQDLLLLARGLGTDLLVESLDRPGEEAVPIVSLADWAAHERRLAAANLRVTRRIDGPGFTLVAVVGGAGTIVSPLVACVRRVPDVAPGGSVALVSDVAANLDAELVAELRAAAVRLGERFASEGFEGLVELDLAVDRRGGGPTLTAIRPDGSLATILDTVSAVGADELPALALHLAAHLGADLEEDVRRFVERPPDSAREPWSLMLLEDAGDDPESVTEAPASGIWRRDPSAHGGVGYVRSATDWKAVSAEDDEAFYLRIARAGSVRQAGTEVGVVVSRGQALDAGGQASESTLQWARGILKNFWTTPAPADALPEGSPIPGVAVL
ncbi:MAG: hypothetical protein FJW96_06680 [Actinobacteria bacterium]|nr:hypothetical protein [Actinomycetota bacterium]